MPAEKITMVAKTFSGLEEVLASELKTLGAEDVKVLLRAVSFSGDKHLMYLSNYSCRTALRILVPIAEFHAPDEGRLYREIHKIEWENFFSPDQTFAIDANISNSGISHSKYAALKAKDAIADRFRKYSGRRPSVDTANPDLQINLKISRDICTVSIDSSGDLLNKRGYRTEALTAPLNEVLAAGMIALSGWRGDSPFTDPMCGSGTLLIEAAMLATKTPAGFYRPGFGFERWKKFLPMEDTLWKDVKNEASASRVENMPVPVTGSDISKEAVQAAQENIRRAGFEGKIDLCNSPFEEFIPEHPGGVLMFNPPYGERLSVEGLHDFYSTIGDTMKSKHRGRDVWIISSALEALKHIGLKPSRKIHLFNGPLECRFLRFEIYEGSRKKGIQAKS